MPAISEEMAMLHQTSQSQENYQLYYLASCPLCIKVLIALWWMKIDVAKKNISMNATYSAELLGGGGKSQMPCLRIEQNDNRTVAI